MDRERVRRFISRVASIAPTRLALSAATSSIRPLAKLGRAALQQRTVPIPQGPAAGLHLDVGWSDVDMCLGTYEFAVQDWVATRVAAQDQPVVYDIGAHVGFFSLIAAKACEPDGIVIAFEPDAANASLIRSNLESNRIRNVELIEAAVGAASGVAHLQRADHSARHHLAEPGEIASPTSPITLVDLVSVDQLVADGQIPAPTIVKIDVEGHEAQVIGGMSATIRSTRPALLVELDGPDDDHVQGRLDSLLAVLEPYGYRWSRLSDSYAHLDCSVAHFVFDAD